MSETPVRKVYSGVKLDPGQGGPIPVYVSVFRSGEKIASSIYPLKHIVRHSPSGFQWGYNGSGPSDLALAVLADLIGLEAASERGFYIDFRRRFVAPAGQVFRVDELDVWAWIDEVMREGDRP